MVELYNAHADTQGLEPHEMHAVGVLAELSAQDCFEFAIMCSFPHLAEVC
jgi:hypothetical protein